MYMHTGKYKQNSVLLRFSVFFLLFTNHMMETLSKLQKNKEIYLSCFMPVFLFKIDTTRRCLSSIILVTILLSKFVFNKSV